MKRKLLSIILCLAMALSLLPTAALAEGAGTTGTIKVNNDNTSYHTLEEAVNAATEAVNGVLTYTITGKVSTTTTDQWIGFIKGGFTGVTKVCFVGEGADAELCISNSQSILGVQGIDVEVSFENLLLSHPNGAWVNDLGNTTKYFACMVRNSNHTVTYTNCTFPNGASNNMYGETVFNGCEFTSTTGWSLWHTSQGTSKLSDCTFTGKRGVKLYTEGTYGTVGSVELKDTTFNLSDAEKAAVEITKPGSVSMDNVSVSGTTAGAIKMNLTDGYSSLDKATVAATGSKISGDFTARVEESKEGENIAVEAFGITDGEFTALEGFTLEALKNYLAPGATINENGKVEMNPVAKVGTTEYNTLEAAFAALNANNYTLELLVDNAWDAATPVYWKAGTKSGSAATLKDAMEAAYANNAGSITIICKPNATITKSPAHINVTGDITVYANGADFGGNDLSIGTSVAPKNKTTTINIYDAKNLVVWGQPVGDRADVWNVNFTDCVNDGSNFLMYRGRENGKATINATLTGCKATGFDDSIIHTTADGRITIKNCEFANNCAPVNIAHKQAGEMMVTVENSTFTNCGETDTTKDLYRYAAPVRIVNNNAAGTVATEVTNCTFADTVGNNGDILIGDGRDGKESKDVSLTVKNTAANVQAQKPGYYNGANTDDSKKKELPLTAADSLNTTIADLLPVTEVDLDEFIKLVTSAGYSFDGTSVAGTGKKLTVKWSPVSGCFDLNGGNHQLGVDCPKRAATGNTPNRLQDPYAQYQLFASATGLSISNVNFVYVPEKVSVCMNGTWGGKDVTPTLAELQLNNSGDTSFAGCTFDKVTVSPYGKGNNNGNTNEQNNASFTGCEFANVTDKYAIKDVYAGNVTVENCTFNNCGGGIYLEGNAKKGTIDISDNNFTNIGTKGLIQFSANGDYTNADIILDGNTATNCGPILRQLNESFDNSNAITKVKGDLTGLLDENGKLTYTGDSLPKTTEENPNPEKPQPTIYTVKFSGSDVADMKVASGTVITLPTPTKSGYTFNGWYDGSTKVSSPYEVRKDVTLTASWSYNYSGGSSYDPTYSVSTPSKTENGSVTVSPKSASKGDTVTVTVKPDSGYVLETLTVTDKNGNELTLKDKGNGKYTFTMPAGKVEVKATFMEDNSMLNFFYDVPNDAYFYEAVKWAVENGITTGVGNDLFAPEQPCTRAQIVTFLWRAAGSPEPKGAASGMTDVVSGSYYEKAVAWAIENGITTGTTTSTFSPDATCTRAQAVTFLARALKAKAASAAEFSDVPTDSYFADAVAWAAANGVTEGIGGGLFGSDNDCTRGQIVTFLYRAYNK